RIADRYTVFRDGEMVGEGKIAETDENALVELMVGRPVDQVFPKQEVAIGEPVLTVSGYRHPTEFEDIGFSLRRGEILGFYGLVGAGRSEFMQALFGITRPSAGAVRIDDEIAVIRSPSEAVKQGIVYVPEERGTQGTIAAMPIFE
ncbi:ATP-binding cassette domain-containing protein, partial [Martelella sp. UBA3392]